MQIFCGALRAATVETLGVVLVLWALNGATGLAVRGPWKSSSTPLAASQVQEAWSRLKARADEAATAERLALDERASGPRGAEERPQWYSAGHWLRGFLPARDHAHRTSVQPGQAPMELAASRFRATYAEERLDHYSQLYGIAARN